MIALRVVAGVTNHFIMRLPEWANTAVLLMFGVTLLQSGDTFDNVSYAVLAHYGSENEWGWILTGLASVRMLALILNGTFAWFAKWSVRIRAASATLCCFAWFCITVGLYLGNPSSTGAKTYAAHLIVDVILAIYLGGQAGKVDRGRWNGRA